MTDLQGPGSGGTRQGDAVLSNQRRRAPGGRGAILHVTAVACVDVRHRRPRAILGPPPTPAPTPCRIAVGPGQPFFTMAPWPGRAETGVPVSALRACNWRAWRSCAIAWSEGRRTPWLIERSSCTRLLARPTRSLDWLARAALLLARRLVIMRRCRPRDRPGRHAVASQL